MSVKRQRAPAQHHTSAHAYPSDSPVIPDYDIHAQEHDGNGVSSFSRSASGSHKRNSLSQQYYPAPTFAQPSQEPALHTDGFSAAPKRSRDVAYDTYNHSNTGRRVASDPLATRDRSGAVDTSTDSTSRRVSIPHKSPLQKLESVLEGRSKEERRARVAEAEMAAQDKVQRTRSTKTAANVVDDRRHTRTDSGASAPPPIPDRRSRVGDFAASTDADTHRYSGKVYSVPGTNTQVSYGAEPRRSQSGHKTYASAPWVDDPDYAPAPPPKDIARADTRRVSKQSTKEHKTSQSSRGPTTLYTNVPVRSADREHANGSSPAANSIYHTPPQVPVDKYARSAAPANQHIIQEPALDAAPTQHGFRLPHIFHRHRDSRRYKEGAAVSEWKKVPTVSLTAADLLLNAPPESQYAAPGDKPWWEKSASERTSSGSHAQANTASYGPYVDARSGQTYFKPPIYLKCGPLLRFRGIYSEPTSSRSTSATKEIWRGSIMIVTIDSKSRYEKAPTLWLFKQPVHMLPPPPSEVKEGKGQVLSPDYVDPVAGQTKCSRVGKTLYVRPVEHLEENVDLSRREDDSGLFEERKATDKGASKTSDLVDGEQVGKVKEVQGARLFAERGCTFWKFNIEIELGAEQQRIAYRINRGPAIGFWVPARGTNMNIMFHSCNGFSFAVDTAQFSGPDPLWRDVLNSHQTRPFHVMLGGGDQIYMDAATRQTKIFKEWAELKNPHHKHTAPFTVEMQDELEKFYLDRYAMWFSSGFFGMANSQIPMVNIWDDHDIMDGYGSYSDSTMSCPVFAGVGAVAFKYYMLFQHQTVPEETEAEEPSWVLGFQRGPYIQQRSRSVFMSLGSSVSFLGLDCRTERTRDLILSEQTWEHAFQRLETELVHGKTKHLIVLLGVPIAYPRLNFLENVLTSRVMDPVKAIGRTGALGGFVNKFDGGVEILDDLDDHWTAKHHKDERNWFIQELQYIAAAKSVRITILGGDVHLAAVGRFFSNSKLNIPKDRDHRYMPNVISSAIVNTPPGDMVADVLNKRDKIHHLDDFTDENMIPLFTVDTDGKPRNNKCLLPRRNWCSIRDYVPSESPISSPEIYPDQSHNDFPQSDKSSIHTNDTRRSRVSLTDSIRRSFSQTRQKITGRLSRSKAPPMAFYNKTGGRMPTQRTSSADAVGRRSSQGSGSQFTDDQPSSAPPGRRSFSINDRDGASVELQRPNKFVRVPTGLSEKQAKRDVHRGGAIDLTDGLTIHINAENVRGDPAGTTTDYHFMVPALDFRGEIPALPDPLRKAKGIKGLFGSMRRVPVHGGSVGASSASIAGTDHGAHERHDVNGDALNGWADEEHAQQPTARRSAAPERPVANNNQPRKSLDDGLYVTRLRGNKAQATTSASTIRDVPPAVPEKEYQAAPHSRKSSRHEAPPAAVNTYGSPRQQDTRLADGRQIRHPHHAHQQSAANMSDIDLDRNGNHSRKVSNSNTVRYADDRAAEDDYDEPSRPNTAKMQEHRKKRTSFAAKAAEAVRGGLAYARGPRRRYPEDFEDDDRSYTDEEQELERERERERDDRQRRTDNVQHYRRASLQQPTKRGHAGAADSGDERDSRQYARDSADAAPAAAPSGRRYVSDSAAALAASGRRSSATGYANANAPLGTRTLNGSNKPAARPAATQLRDRDRYDARSDDDDYDDERERERDSYDDGGYESPSQEAVGGTGASGRRRGGGGSGWKFWKSG